MRVAELRQGPSEPDLFVELRPGVRAGRSYGSRARAGSRASRRGASFRGREAYSTTGSARDRSETCLSRIPPEEIEPHDRRSSRPRRWRAPPDARGVENASDRERCRFILPRGAAIFPRYASLSEVYDPTRSRAQLLRGRERATGDERIDRGAARVRAVDLREKGSRPTSSVVRDIGDARPRTCGRGSAAASLLPMRWDHARRPIADHFFERFLNRGAWTADID